MVRIAPLLLLLVGSVAVITLVVVQRIRSWREATPGDELPRSTAAVMATYGVLLVVAVVAALFVIAVTG
jgi:uncharacterized membrane protein